MIHTNSVSDGASGGEAGWQDSGWGSDVLEVYGEVTYIDRGGL